MVDQQRHALAFGRRAEAKRQLTHHGMESADAELWLTAWQSSLNADADGDTPDFWDRGARWAMDAWMAGQKPTTIEI